ncbi:uncharacterized protein C8Q71DRAFT_725163 [Rhodofomes roseus]|uniref:4Fe-4S ferredoxin-type domain-containing protein n=1 Tax=Rhodofomes roseus TaxID=34475 RepID=A0ABQ8KCB7_9APHY|nr:uncharacterized protein C8Q71DRAFT_725163 [Rhodofomes roseus]KAH9834626.1 hypothetical protein C8Q71DRAFT_725163 [Rhodofomes roseus]
MSVRQSYLRQRPGQRRFLHLPRVRLRRATEEQVNLTSMSWLQIILVGGRARSAVGRFSTALQDLRIRTRSTDSSCIHDSVSPTMTGVRSPAYRLPAGRPWLHNPLVLTLHSMTIFILRFVLGLIIVAISLGTSNHRVDRCSTCRWCTATCVSGAGVRTGDRGLQPIFGRALGARMYPARSGRGGDAQEEPGEHSSCGRDKEVMETVLDDLFTPERAVCLDEQEMNTRRLPEPEGTGICTDDPGTNEKDPDKQNSILRADAVGERTAGTLAKERQGRCVQMHASKRAKCGPNRHTAEDRASGTGKNGRGRVEDGGRRRGSSGGGGGGGQGRRACRANDLCASAACQRITAECADESKCEQTVGMGGEGQRIVGTGEREGGQIAETGDCEGEQAGGGDGGSGGENGGCGRKLSSPRIQQVGSYHCVNVRVEAADHPVPVICAIRITSTVLSCILGPLGAGAVLYAYVPQEKVLCTITDVPGSSVMTGTWGGGRSPWFRAINADRSISAIECDQASESSLSRPLLDVLPTRVALGTLSIKVRKDRECSVGFPLSSPFLTQQKLKYG